MVSLQSAIYVLCAITSIVCLALLARGYMRTGVKLLLWSALCFVFLAINNVLLFVDLVLLGPEISLITVRQASTAVALGILLYGFIWEAD